MTPDEVTKSTILLVDDVPVNILMLEEILTREGFDIDTATTSKEAFEMLENKTPDLILLDVVLPDQSGFDICRKLQEDEKTKEIPVIFLTAKVELKDKLEGFKAGAVDYATKPFNAVEILARVNTHIQLKKSRDLIKKYNEELEQILERRTLKLVRTERQAAFAQLIQGIVHNMRNPLTNIIGGVEMIELIKPGLGEAMADNAPLKEQVDNIWKYLDLIRRSTEKLDVMVSNMMIRSKRDKNKGIKVFDINSVLRQELSFYEVDLHNRRKAVIHTDLWPQSLLINADPSEMAQIFTNLYRNALDAMSGQADAQVKVRSGKSESFAWFSVEDNGPGIPDDIAGRIFDPFFSTKRGKERAEEKDDATTASPTGTGLGLHYCKEIINAGGGRIDMETTVGKGTMFTVYVPLAD